MKACPRSYAEVSFFAVKQSAFEVFVACASDSKDAKVELWCATSKFPSTASPRTSTCLYRSTIAIATSSSLAATAIIRLWQPISASSCSRRIERVWCLRWSYDRSNGADGVPGWTNCIKAWHRVCGAERTLNGTYLVKTALTPSSLTVMSMCQLLNTISMLRMVMLSTSSFSSFSPGGTNLGHESNLLDRMDKKDGFYLRGTISTALICTFH